MPSSPARWITGTSKPASVSTAIPIFASRETIMAVSPSSQRIQERVVTKRNRAQLDDKIREARHRDAVRLDGLELATKTDEIRRVDRC